MTQEAQKLTDQAGTWFYAVERHDDDGFVASGWTELFTESGDIGIIIVDVNARNVWDDCKMENAKCRALASWNALAGIPIEAIESGVVAELVEAARGMLPNNLNMACNMSDEAIIPLDVTFGELRALFDALAKLEASK
jgi:hypothetical protein